MITILPLQDEAKKRERLAGIPGLGKDGEILSMQDGREEIGWAAVDLQVFGAADSSDASFWTDLVCMEPRRKHQRRQSYAWGGVLWRSFRCISD